MNNETFEARLKARGDVDGGEMPDAPDGDPLSLEPHEDEASDDIFSSGESPQE